ncbi:enoyl-CoA hydratase/isomerase family protein [Blastomonas fulva]|uniref:enoyl-CoA hydratase/isomerase family protein n=1 Tax=Blastomonas fulva TaxID=1550728 RepID=UPI003F72F3DF
MPATHVTTTRKGDVLYGTLTPEGPVSSFSMGLLAEIDAFCAEVERDPSVRGAIITGSGRTFSIGSDLAQIERGLDDIVHFREYLTRFNATMDRIEALPVPTIAAVNGMARAGGLEIVLACDLAVIAEDAPIGDVHSGQFAIPAGGSTQRLPRRIGMPRAKELTMSGRFLTAEEAVAWGLCYGSVPAERLIEEAERLMATFTDKPRACLSEIKQLIARSDTMPQRDGVELEIQAFLNYVRNYPYVRDGVAAFRAQKAAKR